MVDSDRANDATPPKLRRVTSPNGFTSSLHDETVINDAVHGHIVVPEACRLIVDTRTFQRLRRVKQTGFLYLVYPGAVHTRFEHCLGVCHIAGQLIRHLRERLQSETSISDSEKPIITDKDVLCIQIAGLCHDLGHGPHSHDFDRFLRRNNPNCAWNHEHRSLLLLAHLLKTQPDINARLREDYGLDDRDFVFINELILGKPLSADQFSWSRVSASNWPFQGRPAPFAFLYEIIANKSTGIDVDKFDYGMRDAMFSGLQFTFLVDRFIRFSRLLLCPTDGLWHICQPEKEAEQIHCLFENRAMLHRRAYNHRVVRAAALLYSDIVDMVKHDVTYPAPDGTRLSLHRTVDNLEVFNLVDDYSLIGKIYELLLARPTTGEPAHLRAARELLDDFDSRRFYPFIGETIVDGKDVVYAGGVYSQYDWIQGYNASIKEELIAIHQATDPGGDVLSRSFRDNCIVHVTAIDYGMKGENPVASAPFYAKNSSEVKFVRKEHLSHMIPMCFMEQYVRVYSRSHDPDQLASIFASFREWCSRHGHTVSRVLFTPSKRPSSSASATPPPSQ